MLLFLVLASVHLGLATLTLVLTKAERLLHSFWGLVEKDKFEGLSTLLVLNKSKSKSTTLNTGSTQGCVLACLNS